MWLPDDVCVLMGLLAGQGHACYAVGGCVRDQLMGITPHDWDIATAATPDEMKACFRGLRTIDTGLKHGTLTVLVSAAPYEITTFRADGGYTDHRRPDSVTFVDDLQRDLSRRDFTVNAMALGPDLVPVDLFGGQNDLHDRLIRCVGDARQRFDEDALRILRGLRFASTLNFDIEHQTAAAMREKKALLGHVSGERIWQELQKLLRGPGVERILLGFPDVLAVVIPEIGSAVGFDQRNRYHHLDVWAHTAKAVSLAPDDPALRLAMLLHDLGKPACFETGDDGVGHFHGHARAGEAIAAAALDKMRMDNATRARVLNLVRMHDMRPEPTGRWLKRRLNALGEGGARDLLSVMRADAGAKRPSLVPEKVAHIDACERELDRLIAEQSCFTIKQLAVDGKDMIRLGIPAGPKVGEALDYLLRQVMDDAIPNDRDELIAAAHNLV